MIASSTKALTTRLLARLVDSRRVSEKRFYLTFSSQRRSASGSQAAVGRRSG